MKTYRVLFSDDRIIALKAMDSHDATVLAAGIANLGLSYVVEVKEITTNADVTCDYVTNADVA